MIDYGKLNSIKTRFLSFHFFFSLRWSFMRIKREKLHYLKYSLVQPDVVSVNLRDSRRQPRVWLNKTTSNSTHHSVWHVNIKYIYYTEAKWRLYRFGEFHNGVRILVTQPTPRGVGMGTKTTQRNRSIIIYIIFYFHLNILFRFRTC